MIDENTQFPHSIISEKFVLSAIFNTPEFLGEFPALSENHFHLPNTRLMFQTLRYFIGAGKPMDSELILQYLLDKDLLQRIGGPIEVAKLLNGSTNHLKVASHIEVLNEKLARRMALQAAEALHEAAYTSETTQEILEATGAPITAIQDAILSLKPSEDMKTVMARVIDQMNQRMAGKATSMGIKTAIPIIDHKLRGLHKGQTVVVSGYPSGGKSVLGGQLCAESFLAGENTLFVSLEMSKDDLSKRLLAYVAGIKGMAIVDPTEYALRESSGQRKQLTPMELSKIARATKTILDAPFEIERLQAANEQTISAVIRKHQRTRQLSLVCVDYAQRIRASAETRGQSREQQLSHASKALADLAAELGFALVLLSQLNKDGAAKHAEAINEDCDLHLQIVQDPKTKEHKGISVPKDRHHGMMGAILPVKLEDEWVKFVETTQRS